MWKLSYIAMTLLICLLASSMAFANPQSEEIQIQGITSAGTGCPSGTVATDFSPDRKAFSLIFDEFLAEVGPGIDKEQRKRHCRVKIDIQVPQGWTPIVHELDHRGFAQVPPGIVAQHKRVHKITESPLTRRRFRDRFSGPFSDDYKLSDSVSQKIISFGCGETKTWQIDVQVGFAKSSSDQEGLVTLDSLEGKLTQERGLSWKRCETK